MPELTRDVLQIAYDGPAVANGRMKMLDLAVGLQGQALLIDRVAKLYLPPSTSLVVEIDDRFEKGSLAAPIHIIGHGLKVAQDLLASPPVSAIANLLQLLGFFGFSGTTLYSLFQARKGRKIASVEDVPPERDIRIPLQLLIDIYNDDQVQKHLRRTLSPLRTRGIEVFQTRVNRIPMATVSKADLELADAAELEDISTVTEVELAVEKAAYRRDLDWHLNNGKTSFDASITDDKFWKDVAGGQPFSAGDSLIGILEVSARRSRSGTLRVQRRVTKVDHLKHRSSPSQTSFDYRNES